MIFLYVGCVSFVARQVRSAYIVKSECDWRKNGVRLEFGLPWAWLGFDWTPNSERLRFQVGLKSFKLNGHTSPFVSFIYF